MIRVPHYNKSYICLFFVLSLFRHASSIHVNTLASTETLTLSSNRTIVSPSEIFELGFFKTGSNSTGDDRWYLGIWYKKSPNRIYVWVANRDKPLSSTTGTLKISYNNLVLLDQADKAVWSTNVTRGDVNSPVIAELLGSGNFVLRYVNKNEPSEFLWQSFDFPTDTLLPEMKLGWDLKTGLNRSLTSWKSQDDPSSGRCWIKLHPQGFPQLFFWQQGITMYRAGPWNGVQFSGIPDKLQLNYMFYNLTNTTEEITYKLLMINNSAYSRLTVSSEDIFEAYTWIPSEQDRTLYVGLPEGSCDTYSFCGVYSYCDTNTLPICNCIQGFVPINEREWSFGRAVDGCKRKTPLSCDGNGFLRLKNMKLPDTTWTTVDMMIGLKECKKRCENDCNCTAYANADIRKGGSGCILWTGKLTDIRYYAVTGQDLYVKLDNADLGGQSNRKGKVIGLVVGVISTILILGFIVFCVWKRKQKRATTIAAPNVTPERDQDVLMNQMVIPSDLKLARENITEDLELPSTEFKLLVKATDNFSDSNKLGEGGFGSVYKGRSVNGEEFAVKRLSELSHQGSEEFKIEVKVISRLQHINLVRILGCCTYKDEKMLIYEYLENLSLDRHIFDEERSINLKWERRLEIANGIARGILYLHHDSRCRVIHRDLKASNILLDKDMVPKISDFGMARIFSKNEHEAITRRIVGTCGYMSPEYAMDGKYSEKSDVFSFGVLLLEIITGKKNRGFYNPDMDSNLLSYVWRNMEEGTGLKVADSNMIDLSSPSSTFQSDEILRCITIALLCVQHFADDRPGMLSVISMLGSDKVEIPKPKEPAFCHVNTYDTGSSSSSSTFGFTKSGTSTFGYTMSDIQPR